VQIWLARHPRIHLHFTPTYASWLNLVEVFFSILERQALRRGDFTSVEDLMAATGRHYLPCARHAESEDTAFSTAGLDVLGPVAPEQPRHGPADHKTETGREI